MTDHLPKDARNGDVYRVIDGELFKLEAGKGPEVKAKGECPDCGRCATCGKAKDPAPFIPAPIPYIIERPYWIEPRWQWPTYFTTNNNPTTTDEYTITSNAVELPSFSKAGVYVSSDDKASPYPFEVSHG